MRATTKAIMLIFLVGAIGSTFRVASVDATPEVLIVTDQYPTIQEAVDAASPGDTILVAHGTYHEHVLIQKDDLVLVGEDPSTTVIDGGGTGSVILVIADNVEIRGFTIRNGYYGILLYNSRGCTIVDNTVLDNDDGIDFQWLSRFNTVARNNVTSNKDAGIDLDISGANTISNNTLSNNRVGIRLYTSSYSALINNTVSGCEWGIYMYNGERNVLRDNNMTRNRYNFGVASRYSFALWEFIHDIDTSNTINGKPIYYLINEKNLVIDSDTFSDIG